VELDRREGGEDQQRADDLDRLVHAASLLTCRLCLPMEDKVDRAGYLRRVPSASGPLFEQRQLRKRWRYIGLFAEEVMLCAARAEVGPLTQSFWVLLDRSSGQPWSHTALRPGSKEVTMDGPQLEIDGPGLRASLR